MHTIPLYTPPSHPNAWHQVRAPGGYECWRFAAHDTRSDRQIIVTFAQGSATDPDYLREYERYLRRPTTILPPLPHEHASVSLALYERGKTRAQFEQTFAPQRFSLSADQPVVNIGVSRFHFDGSRYAVKLPTASFSFRPRFAHVPLELAFGEHRWILAAPMCDVEGTIAILRERVEFAFDGIGYHDHRYGTAPFPREVRRWIAGHALIGDAACAFQQFEPGATHLVECDASGLREVPGATMTIDGSGARVDSMLQLQNPRMIDSTMLYDARYRDRAGTALCEIAYPHRLRASLLGRIFGMSIDKRSAFGA